MRIMNNIIIMKCVKNDFWYIFLIKVLIKKNNIDYDMK